MYWILFGYLIVLITSVSALSPQPGVFHYEFLNNENWIGVPKALYKGSEIYILVECHGDKQQNVTVQANLHELRCWPDSVDLETALQTQNSGKSHPHASAFGNCICPCHVDLLVDQPESVGSSSTVNPPQDPLKTNTIVVDVKNVKRNSGNQTSDQNIEKKVDGKYNVFSTLHDGVYSLTVNVTVINDDKETSYKHNVTVDIKMNGPHGYLSAVDWPLLTFYGAMCFVYIIFGIGWLIVSFMQWRDLLRIQFWICAVILLGMLEKAMFFAEYDTINNVGENLMPGLVLLAEFVSCAKRTLARMLVIIASFGFGIVKPRLGSHLHRIVLIGTIYFFAAAWEAYSRVTNSQRDHLVSLLVATVSLAILDSFICWWIFTNLVQTTRTLRLRRNLVKLSLYNNFTNTLICAVILSVLFMIYSIRTRTNFDCISEWKTIWIDDAFWHLLFSVILLVIMILWRPTNNNQRYAFSPLLDAADDDDDDDEDIEQYVNDAYGVKMRGYSNCRSDSPKHRSQNSADDDLKWVEDNIPPTLISASLPIIDSDEEIMNTKFEISKME